MHKRAFQALKRTVMHVRVFPHHFLIKNQFINYLVFLIKIRLGEICDMHKCAFQGLKRTLMHVSGLHSPCFHLKTN